MCPHSRIRSNSIVLRDLLGHPEGVVFTVSCHECGAPFIFPGIQSSESVLVSEDRHEVRILIAETRTTPQDEV